MRQFLMVVVLMAGTASGLLAQSDDCNGLCSGLLPPGQNASQCWQNQVHAEHGKIHGCSNNDSTYGGVGHCEITYLDGTANRINCPDVNNCEAIGTVKCTSGGSSVTHGYDVSCYSTNGVTDVRATRTGVSCVGNRSRTDCKCGGLFGSGTDLVCTTLTK